MVPRFLLVALVLGAAMTGCVQTIPMDDPTSRTNGTADLVDGVTDGNVSDDGEAAENATSDDTGDEPADENGSDVDDGADGGAGDDAGAGENTTEPEQVELTLDAHDRYFTLSGENTPNPVLAVPADAPVTLKLKKIDEEDHAFKVETFSLSVSGSSGASVSFGWRSPETGAYTYYCTNHPNQMRGTILVGDVDEADREEEAWAREMLEDATANLTAQKVGFTVTREAAGKTLLTAEGFMDVPNDTFYQHLSGDRDYLKATEEGTTGLADLIANGLVIHTNGTRATWVVNGAAYPSVTDEAESPDDDDTLNMGLPSESFTSETATILAADTRYVDNVRTAIILFEGTSDAGASVAGTFLLHMEPARLHQLTIHEAADDDVYATHNTTITWSRDIFPTVPENFTRANRLAWQADRPMTATSPWNWTFAADSGIPLADVEVHLKPEAGEDDGGGEAHERPSNWTVTLADIAGTSHTGNNVTVTFDDVDGDGTVSAGDLLTVTWDGDAVPNILLRDTVTGMYLAPGAGWAVVAALAGLAAGYRRRR